MNKNSLTYTIIFTFVSSFVLVVPLSLANEATKPLVAQNKALETARAIMGSMGYDLSGKSSESILADFQNLERYQAMDGVLSPLTQGATATEIYYRGNVAGRTRWSGTFAGPGLWGTITVAIGIEEDLATMVGLEILSQQETPGLGGRIEEPWFKDQFDGQSLASGPLKINAIGTGTGDPVKTDAAFDGVTGATRSSESIRDLVNKAAATFKTLLSGGVQ